MLKLNYHKNKFFALSYTLLFMLHLFNAYIDSYNEDKSS